MFRKNYFTFLLAAALFLIGSVAAFAQTAPISGKVEVKKADGTTAPVAGALVEVFRLDQKTKLPSDKTGKKGDFAFAGLPLGARYILSVSGAGISPLIYPNVPAGADNFTITVSEGDGKRFTEEEVRQAIANKSTNTTSTETKSSEPTEEEKKAQAEREKQIADYNSKKQKAENNFALVNTVLKEGDAAYKAGNYDLAIAKFDEGINADPNFAGSAPVLLNYKGLALNKRGTDTYNKSLKADEATKTAARESVKKDYEEAVAASNKALEILKTATSTDANVQKGYETQKLSALTNRKESYRLMSKTGVERTKGKEALTAYQEYMAAEADAKLKNDAQYELATTLQNSDEFEMSVAEFEKILAADPNNVDALAGIGLSLVNVGYVNMEKDEAKGKAQLQQAANYLQKFVDTAPATHPYKEEAKGIITTLKSQQNLTPQKVTTTKKKQ
jgi:tetratricopeptide (TPR) repeat protein